MCTAYMIYSYIVNGAVGCLVGYASNGSCVRIGLGMKAITIARNRQVGHFITNLAVDGVQVFIGIRLTPSFAWSALLMSLAICSNLSSIHNFNCERII